MKVKCSDEKVEDYNTYTGKKLIILPSLLFLEENTVGIMFVYAHWYTMGCPVKPGRMILSSPYLPSYDLKSSS